MAKGKRPNFILFMADQLRADHLGCYGNPIVRTPTIDGLAAGGTSFDRFYVTCPICMPNRIAMMTSRMPTVNGSRHNGIPLDLDAVTFVDLLRAGGYYTGLVGKSHLQNAAGGSLDPNIFPRNVVGAPPPEALRDASRRRRTGPEYSVELRSLWRADPDRQVPSPYYGFEWVRLANSASDRAEGHYNKWLSLRHPDPESLRGPENALPSKGIVAPQTWRTSMPEELYPTTYIADTTIEFLEERAASDDSKPFFLHCSIPDPHHPWAPPGHYFDMYDPDDIPLPASFAVESPDDPEFAKRLRREYREGRPRNQGPMPFACGPEAVRQATALTYGLISMIDDSIGRILRRLDELGLAEDTVVMMTSDHGDFMGDHGLMLKHGLHYEGVIRVPFIWNDPDEGEARRIPMLGGTIDIGPTILARAGLAPNNGVQGFDLIGAVRNGEEPPRHGMLIEEDELGAHLGIEQGLRTRSFIRGTWRLTMWEGMPDGELFDREADPEEIYNLWKEPAFAAVRAELMEAMLREMIRLSDTAPLAEFIA